MANKLYSSSKQKQNKATKAIVGCSLALAVSIVPLGANAGLLEWFDATISNLYKNRGEQASKIVNSIKATTTQTALYPMQVSAAINSSQHTAIAVTSGRKVAQDIAEITQDHKIGVGNTPNLGCAARQETLAVQTQGVLKQQASNENTRLLSSEYALDNSNKRATRTLNHLVSFCDVSEVKYGTCTTNADGMGGMDSNYGNIGANNALSDEQLMAAQAYVYTVIDPANTLDETCETMTCKATRRIQRSYNTLAGMAQGALVSQINDRKTFDLSGKYDYSKDVGKANEFNEKTVNPDQVGGTVTSGSTPPASSASKVASTATPTSKVGSTATPAPTATASSTKPK